MTLLFVQIENFSDFFSLCNYLKVQKAGSIFFFFLGQHPRHMEVPRQGAELELQLPAYTTATAMLEPSHVCDLHHSNTRSLTR